MINSMVLRPNERILIESRRLHDYQYKVAGPGRVWIGLRQREITRFSVGPQVENNHFDEVRTVENVALDITVRTLYRVDPALFSDDLLPRVAGLNAGVWQQLVEVFVGMVLRPLVAGYTWSNLEQSSIRQRLERQLTQTIADRLSVIGLNVISVSIIKMELPPTLQQAVIRTEKEIVAAKGRATVLEEYAAVFGSDLSQAMPSILQWELLHQLGKNNKAQHLLLSSGLSLGTTATDADADSPHHMQSMMLPIPGSKSRIILGK